MGQLEKKMWQQLSEAIGTMWDATRHEDKYNKGIPDVSFGAPFSLLLQDRRANGWIELKALEKWPANPQTVVKIEHYTPEQRLWILKRGRMGGRVWLLLKIFQTETWLLFDHVNAQKVGKLTASQLMASARIWNGKISAIEFVMKISQ